MTAYFAKYKKKEAIVENELAYATYDSYPVTSKQLFDYSKNDT